MTKMRRVSFLTTICFLALFIFVSHGNALFDSNVDKAKEFMQAGMYQQAITLLEKEINENPTNEEAHFQLGICYVNQSNYSNADDRFSSAVRLKPDYGYQIGEEYKKAGKESISKGNNSGAKSLFSKAVAYQPNLKKEIAPLYFDIGKSYLDQHRSDIADEYLSLARNYDASLKDDVKAITQNYGKKLLDMAKDKPKEERKKYVDEALKYVTQEAIDSVLPPPTWTTVFKKDYTGKGMGNNDDFGSVEIGKDLLNGDKSIITGQVWEMWHNGKWRRYEQRAETINKSNATGKRVGLKVPKGKKVTYEIQRLISSY